MNTEFGDYKDNRAAIKVAEWHIKRGHVSEARKIISELWAWILERRDAQSQVWIIPELNRLEMEIT